MKIVNLILFGAWIFMLSSPIQAQDSTQTSIRIGIGITIGKDLSYFDGGDLVFLPIGFSNVYLPILINNSKFRIEPEIGLFRASSSYDDYESTSTSLRLGLGLFPTTRKNKTLIYYGLRFGIIYTSESSKSDFDSHDESKTDFFIGPAIGGEYFISDHFSFGGEVQLNYISIGQEDDYDNESVSALSNRTLIFVRWYF